MTASKLLRQIRTRLSAGRVPGFGSQQAAVASPPEPVRAPVPLPNNAPSAFLPTNWSVQARSPLLCAAIADLCALVESGGLLGTHPHSRDASITISGIAAIGLEAIGSHAMALALVEAIKQCQIHAGSNAGAFQAPDRLGGYRSVHNWGNYWGLSALLAVEPQSASSENIRTAIGYLLDHQQGGAWGLSDCHRPKPYYTAHVLRALMHFHASSDSDALATRVEQAIDRGIKCLCGQSGPQALSWPEDPRSQNQVAHLPSTLAALIALAQYQVQYARQLYRPAQLASILDSFVKPQIDWLLQLTDAGVWPKVQDNELPTFHTWLAIPSLADALLQVGMSPWDSTVIDTLGWIEKHTVVEEGITGLEAGASDPGHVVNWTTGHALIGIGAWEKSITRSIESQDFVAMLLPHRNTVEKMSAARCAERLEVTTQWGRRWKRLAIAAASVSALTGGAILVIFIAQNPVFWGRNAGLLIDWIQRLAVNPLLMFVIGLMGILPLLYGGMRWLMQRFLGEGRK